MCCVLVVHLDTLIFKVKPLFLREEGNQGKGYLRLTPGGGRNDKYGHLCRIKSIFTDSHHLSNSINQMRTVAVTIYAVILSSSRPMKAMSGVLESS